MIEIKNLTKIYKETRALDNATLTFEQGKIYGVLGRNGAGKTTLINIMTNRAFASGGTVLIDGANASENDAAQEKIFCITEQSTYPAGNKVQTALLWAKRFYPNFDTDYAHELCEKFGIDKNKKFNQLSTGYTTIAKVIITLASGAPVMIFDEPVLGIDAIFREVYYEELKKTHERLKNTIIISTHILDEVEDIVDIAVIIKRGKIVFNDCVANIKSKTLEQYYLEIHKNDIGKNDLDKSENTVLKAKMLPTKIDRNKFVNTMLYGLKQTWINLFIPVPIYIVLLTMGVFLKDYYSMLDVIGIGNIIFIGAVIHAIFFKYAVYNGISRKTYYLANLTYLLGFAVLAALFATLASMGSYFIDMQFDISYLLYGFHFGATFVWLFSAMLCVTALFLLCLLVFCRLSRRERYIALFIILGAGIFLTLLSVLVPSASPINALLFILGLKFKTPNPWFSAICLLLLSSLFFGAGWLVLRKQEIR